MRPDATRPSPAEGEVLIAVEACGICGSDLHTYRNDSHRNVNVRRTPEGYDVPGHEFAGTIAELGEGVEDWQLGERVVGVTGFGGGMAEFVTVPVNPFQLVRIPEGVSFREAATTEPLADGLQMVRKSGLLSGENAVVFGVGIIGLGVIQAIRARGIEPRHIVAIDVHDSRLEKALDVGATHTINARNGAVFDQVSAVTGTDRDWLDTSANIHVVYECAGYIKHLPGPPPLETALKLVAINNGRIVCFGAYEDRMNIDLMPIVNKQVTIMGSLGYAAEELIESLEYMRTGVVDRQGLISHTFPLDSIYEAFETQCAPTAVKVMIDVRKQS